MSPRQKVFKHGDTIYASTNAHSLPCMKSSVYSFKHLYAVGYLRILRCYSQDIALKLEIASFLLLSFLLLDRHTFVLLSV